MIASSRYLGILLQLASLSLTIEPPRTSHQPTGHGDRFLTFNDTTPIPKLRPYRASVRWTGSGRDGQYTTSNSAGDLILVDAASGNNTIILPARKRPADVRDYWIPHDQRTVLVASNATKKYRHSYSSDYFIIDIETGQRKAIVDDQAGDIQYAKLAPIGNTIAFVRYNDLFLREGDGSIHQVTSNGGPDMFNGIPDWVYEEEVLSDRFALWYSPDAKYIAFMSFNETGVGTITYPNYMAGKKIAPSYPQQLEVRYPKVGTPNPTVALNILDVQSKAVVSVPLDAFPKDDMIIGEVAWVTDQHSALIYRAFNRVQDKEKHVVFNLLTKVSKTTRTRDGSDGWLENSLAISYVGNVEGSSSRSHYVDLSDESGWMHIYLFPLDGGKSIQLTTGEWEVDSILHIDTSRKLVYFKSATHHSTERHIYSVNYATKEIKHLVDDETPAFWDASFSSKGGYYVLTYDGPDVPYQELYLTNDTSKPLRTINSNSDFYRRINEYNLPNITYFEMQHPEGFSLNVMQQLPPNFDRSKKYPVLFTPYGGPNSQSVSKVFQLHGWKTYISSEPTLEYVLYTVDNRGTGFKGRKFRCCITKHVGDFETKDQIWAAQQLLARNSFLDANRVGMWGWSHGGYITAKTIEANSGVFSFGLSTAPVSDWRLYDSINTERYMKTLAENPEGYNKSAIRDTAGFKNISGVFALMHGTGDDNVHYQNTAALADLLVGDGVSPEKFMMMAFTDSDHGINYHGALSFLYKFLTARLWDEVQRTPGSKVVHPWSRRSQIHGIPVNP